jgi:hypothetical protein
VIYLSGCGDATISLTPTPNEKYVFDYSQYTIEDIITDDMTNESIYLENIDMHKFPEDDFLFSNLCFSFYRDMDYFLMFSARYDFTDLILQEYMTQAVRKVEADDGYEYLYFVYETDGETRVFIFFEETTGFVFTRGQPVIMKEVLSVADFQDISVGDTMLDIGEIDPIISLYMKAYDSVPEKAVKEVYDSGREKISTLHMLADGILRYDYHRVEKGNYIVDRVIFSEDFILPELGGDVNYKIYDYDYVS